MLVVDADSASPQLPGVTYYGIEATHSGMSRFGSVNAPGFRTVSDTIREWVGEAPQVIEVRWGIEEEDRLARAKHDIDERTMSLVSTSHAQHDDGALPPNLSGSCDIPQFTADW